jgi:hypothetical protein
MCQTYHFWKLFSQSEIQHSDPLPSTAEVDLVGATEVQINLSCLYITLTKVLSGEEIYNQITLSCNDVEVGRIHQIKT